MGQRQSQEHYYAGHDLMRARKQLRKFEDELKELKAEKKRQYLRANPVNWPALLDSSRSSEERKKAMEFLSDEESGPLSQALTDDRDIAHALEENRRQKAQLKNMERRYENLQQEYMRDLWKRGGDDYEMGPPSVVNAVYPFL